MPLCAQQPQFTGCDKLLQAANNALQAKQYDQALNKFLALRDCDPSYNTQAEKGLKATFDAINAEKNRATDALASLNASNASLLYTLVQILHKANARFEFDNAADFCAGIANLADLARRDTSALRAVGTAAFAAAYMADSVVKKTPYLLDKPKNALQVLYPQHKQAFEGAENPADLRRLLPQVLPQATYLRLLRQYLADMLPVAGGEGVFGKPSYYTPARYIRVSDFEMGRTEVTVYQYNFYCRATGKPIPTNPFPDKQDGTHPIVDVSWYDAVAYCNWLSEVMGKQPAYTGTGSETQCNLKATGYRLPTEAEWKYAAYGGQKGKGWMKQTEYAGSDSIDRVAWYGEDYSKGSTHPVARKKPNALGLYDLSGNVWEWCWNYWADAPPLDPEPDYAGPATGSSRVYRGGSWYNADVRVDSRDASDPGNQGRSLGFRLARTAR